MCTRRVCARYLSPPEHHEFRISPFSRYVSCLCSSGTIFFRPVFRISECCTILIATYLYIVRFSPLSRAIKIRKYTYTHADVHETFHVVYTRRTLVDIWSREPMSLLFLYRLFLRVTPAHSSE